ncbi:MAG: TonB-dependent receptor [Halieaceae bacterium]|jgi:iron complex outermembrane receptor protein|nr:TonB-dependent receptor [Halieaceae bacterium]
MNHCRNSYRDPIANLAAAVAIASVALPAFSLQLEEVVVTAQKREQGANDVGIAITTFTGEQIRELGILSAEDIAMYTPGVTVNETAATGVPLYTIRGVGFQDYSTAASSTVGIYFDGVAMPYTVMTRGLLFDTDRVEILKGPQGDLYGRNTTAGQINFISKEPTEEFSAGVTASYGRYEALDLEGYVSGSLSDSTRGRLAVRIAQSGEGWQENTVGDDKLGEDDVMAIRGTLVSDFSDSFSAKLMVSYVDDQSDNTANTAYPGSLIGIGDFTAPYVPLDQYVIPGNATFGQTPPWYSVDDNTKAGWTNSYTSALTGKTFDLRPQRDNQSTNIMLRLDWAIGDATLTSISGYSDFQREESNDWDGGFYNDSSNINTTDLQVFSQELRLAGESDRLNWVVGLYYSQDDMDEYYHYFMSDSVYGYGSIPFGVGLFAPNPILELDTKYEQETTSAAVFGHVEYELTDALKLVAGARYTNEKRDWTGCTYVADDGSLGLFLNNVFGLAGSPFEVGPGDCGTINDIGGFDPSFNPYSDKIDTGRATGKVGLDWTPSDDLLVYGSISNGFKSGGFNGANSNTTTQLIPYEEEVLTAYELGTKATLAGGTMQVNGAVFYYDYKDKQEQDAAVTLVGNISGLTNVDESEIYGAEVEFTWQPTEGLTLAANGAWLDSEVKKWQAVDRATSSYPNNINYYDASGQELAMTPDFSYTLYARYEMPITNSLMLDLSADYNQTGKTTGGPRPEDATEEYGVANARVGLGSSSGNWRVMAWVRNLTDEDYYPSAYTGGNGPYVRTYGMPRTYGLTFSYFIGQ